MKNNKDLFNGILSKHYSSIYNYALWLSQDTSIAEDLTQETFLRAWRSFSTLNNPDAIKPWLFIILKRENYRRLGKEVVEYCELDFNTIEDTLDPYSQYINSKTLYYYVKQLPSRYYEPLMIQLATDSAHQDIADQLNTPLNTVRTRLRRAQHYLKTIVNDTTTTNNDMKPATV